MKNLHFIALKVIFFFLFLFFLDGNVSKMMNESKKHSTHSTIENSSVATASGCVFISHSASFVSGSSVLYVLDGDVA